MRFKNSRWMIVVGAVVAFLVLATIVWASPPMSPSSAPLQATPGFDADKVDGHDAVASSLSNSSQRANKLVWTKPNGSLDIRSMPMGDFSKRLLNAKVADTMSASTGGYVLTVDNTGTGHGLKGEAGSGGDGVVGQAFNSSKSGVYGVHNGSGYGVTGRSASGDGVWGISSGAGKSGVWGYHTANGYGVTGRSIDSFGVHAWGAGDSSGYDAIGDLVLHGTRGEIFAFGNYLNLYSNWNVNISLDENNNDSNGAFRIWDGADNQVFRVEEDGDTWASGTKGAFVQTDSHGERGLYAMESPEVWFEDFGTASLVDGVAEVQIEPIFAETVNLEIDYHVFLTPLSVEPVLLFVTNKTATKFAVRGVTLDGQPAVCAFDYRIVAKRLGYEDVRLEEPQLSSSPDGI